jgi:uncharacterized membrane protein
VLVGEEPDIVGDANDPTEVWKRMRIGGKPTPAGFERRRSDTTIPPPRFPGGHDGNPRGGLLVRVLRACDQRHARGANVNGAVSALRVRAREAVRSSLWFVPTVCALGAVGLWIGLRYLDDSGAVEDLPFGFDGGPDGAREVLSAISTSMIAFTGVVFSVTIVALQLAGSQYSPRVLRSFLRDRRTQAALGSFIATFVYALLVLRGVRGGEDQYVPRLSVGMAFVILAVSLALFVVYVHEISQSIRASHIVARIGREARGSIETLVADDERFVQLPTVARHASADVRSITAPEAGIVQAYDTRVIVRLAREHDARVESSVCVGDFVPFGATIGTITPASSDLDCEQIQARFVVGLERTIDQDLRFGLRQLVDVALRALSPGINDPTTAVQAIDQLHDLLRRLAPRSFRSGVHTDERGEVRFVERLPSWDELVDLAVTEIRHAGGDQVQVRRRLLEMLDDLASVALVRRRRALRRQRELLLHEPATRTDVRTS